MSTIRQWVNDREFAKATELQRRRDLAAVEVSGLNIRDIPVERRNYEIRAQALLSNVEAIQFLSDEERTEDLCTLAARMGETAIFDHLTPQQRTPEVLREYVKKWPTQIGRLPPPERTEELCLLAIDRDDSAQVFEYLDDADRTPAVCKRAVERERRALALMTQAQRTPAVREAALRANGMALENIPRDEWTDDLIMLALGKNGRAIQFVPKAQRTDDMRKTAVISRSSAIKDLDHEERTDEICLAALQAHPRVFTYLQPQEAASLPQTAAWIEANWTSGAYLCNLPMTDKTSVGEWAQQFVTALDAQEQDAPAAQHRQERGG